MDYSRKKQTGGLRTYYFEKTPGIFRFFTLPLEIGAKIGLHPQKLHKIVLQPSEILRPKTRTTKNSKLFFNLSSENPLAVSSIPLEISYPQTPVCFFLEQPIVYQVLKVLLIKSFKMQQPHLLISCCLHQLLHQQISLLELYSKLFEKRNFCHGFPFF